MFNNIYADISVYIILEILSARQFGLDGILGLMVHIVLITSISHHTFWANHIACIVACIISLSLMIWKQKTKTTTKTLATIYYWQTEPGTSWLWNQTTSEEVVWRHEKNATLVLMGWNSREDDSS